MQAVILAAGRGVRMSDLTNDLPKSLIRLGGRPILEYTLTNLPQKISELIFVIGYKGELIKSHFGERYQDKKIRYIVQENLNGTAGALHCAKEFLEDEFLVLNGDDLYSRLDLEKITANGLALLAKEIEKPDRF